MTSPPSRTRILLPIEHTVAIAPRRNGLGLETDTTHVQHSAREPLSDKCDNPEFKDYLISLFEQMQEALLAERRQVELAWRCEIGALEQNIARTRSKESAGMSANEIVLVNLPSVQADKPALFAESCTKSDACVQTKTDWAMPISPDHSSPSVKRSQSMTVGLKRSRSMTSEKANLLTNWVSRRPSVNQRETTSNKDKLRKLLSVQELGFAPAKPTRHEHKVFLIDQFMGIVTCVNLVMIGISCDIGVGWSGWLIIDSCFAFLFLCEFLAKVSILGWKRYFRGDDWQWNVLEAALVALALLELAMGLFLEGEDKAKLAAFRIVRCTRITRLVHVRKMMFFVELAQMVQGAIGGMRTLLWAAVLISVPLYALALVLHETLGQYESIGTNLFSSLASSLLTVWRCIVANDCNQEDGKPIFVHVCDQYGWSYGMIYTFTHTLLTFGLFNVIVAIYVENILAASKYNDLIRKRHRLEDDKMMVSKMLELVSLIARAKQDVTQDNVGETIGLEEDRFGDTSDLISKAADVQISRDRFKALLKNRRFRDCLAELDIAIEDQVGLFESLDVDDNGSLSMPELVQGVKALRGDPRRSDIIHVSLVAKDIQEKAVEFHEDLLALWKFQEKGINQTSENCHGLNQSHRVAHKHYCTR